MKRSSLFLLVVIMIIVNGARAAESNRLPNLFNVQLLPIPYGLVLKRGPDFAKIKLDSESDPFCYDSSDPEKNHFKVFNRLFDQLSDDQLGTFTDYLIRGRELSRITSKLESLQRPRL